MEDNSESSKPRVVCRACGAQLEVRVSFRGKIVWTVDPEDPDFGGREPELRGESKEPSLVCSADVMHATGFRLLNGAVEPA